MNSIARFIRENLLRPFKYCSQKYYKTDEMLAMRLQLEELQNEMRNKEKKRPCMDKVAEISYNCTCGDTATLDGYCITCKVPRHCKGNMEIVWPGVGARRPRGLPVAIDDEYGYAENWTNPSQATIAKKVGFHSEMALTDWMNQAGKGDNGKTVVTEDPPPVEYKVENKYQV